MKILDSYCSLEPANAALDRLLCFYNKYLDRSEWTLSDRKIVVRFSCKGLAADALKAASNSEFTFGLVPRTCQVDNPGLIEDAYPGFNRYAVLELPVSFLDPRAPDMWDQMTRFGFFIDDAVPVVTIRPSERDTFYIPDLLSVMYKVKNDGLAPGTHGRIVYRDLFKRKFTLLLPNRGSIFEIMSLLEKEETVLHVRPVELVFDALA